MASFSGDLHLKEHTSKFLKAIAYLYLAFPISYLAYSALLFNISPERALKILFSFSYWGLSLSGMLVGYGLREMTRWAWNAFLFNSFFVAYANAIIASRYSQSNEPFLAFFASIGLLIFLVLRLGREIRVPYFLPRIRWWEANPRYKLVVPVQIERQAGSFDAEILDISMGGCFVKTRMDLVQNERLLASFVLFGEKLSIGGTVVWRSQSSVTHPKGVGVKFDELDPFQKKVMKAATHHLKKISNIQNSRNKMSPEEFNQKMQEMRSFRLGFTSSSDDKGERAS